MSSVIRDPLIEMVTARWDCVNASGPCDCDNGVNAARVAQQEYARKQMEYPIEPTSAEAAERIHGARSRGTWLHRLFVRLAERTR